MHAENDHNIVAHNINNIKTLDNILHVVRMMNNASEGVNTNEATSFPVKMTSLMVKESSFPVMMTSLPVDPSPYGVYIENLTLVSFYIKYINTS